jgi:hypothetical protein
MLLLLLLIPILSLISHFITSQPILTLAYSLINLIHTLFIIHLFDSSESAFQFLTLGIFAIDGISLSLI